MKEKRLYVWGDDYTCNDCDAIYNRNTGCPRCGPDTNLPYPNWVIISSRPPRKTGGPYMNASTSSACSEEFEKCAGFTPEIDKVYLITITEVETK